MDNKIFNQLKKEDKQHCEIIYHLMRNEAMLATIIHQLGINNDDETSIEIANYLNTQMENKKAEIETLIKKLVE